MLQADGCAARRNFAIVTILAYAGLRISECINIRKSDICLESAQLKVTDGKGEKARIVIISSKIVSAVCEYQKTDHVESLRHFYAVNAVSSGIFTIPEIASQMGHTSIKTTMRYMNPNLDEIRQKVEKL